MNGIIKTLFAVCILTGPVLALSEGQYQATITGRYQSTQPTPKQPIERQPRILCFTATWCEPCQVMKRDSFEWLKAAGWQIDGTNRAHLQLIDSDERPELLRLYGVETIPMLVLIQGDIVVARSNYHGRGTYAELLGKLKKGN